jgi:ankyrin repeat protein
MNADETRLMEAVRKGDAGAVRELLAADRRLASARTPEGVPAILLAVYHRHPEIARVFLDHGAEPDVFAGSALGLADRVRSLVAADPALARAHGPDGHTPLGLAAFFGHREVVKLLLEAGADANARSRNAMRVAPIHAAAAAHDVAIVRLLVEAGADVNAAQEKGFVALHEAASEGDMELIRVLVEAGARIDALTEDGRSAEDLAREKGRDEAVRTLQSLRVRG